MKKKKIIKVTLGTVICINIILFLVISGVWHYYDYIQNSNNNNQNIISTNAINEIVNTNENKTENTDIISKKPSETINVLFNNYLDSEKYIISLLDDNTSKQGIQFYENEILIGDAILIRLQSEYIASSTYKENGIDYNANNLGDFFIDKCWCEGSPESGIGETIEINTFASCEKVEWNSEQKRSMESLDDTINYLLTDHNIIRNWSQNN